MSTHAEQSGSLAKHSKIQRHQLQRGAIVYIRQSTMQQVERNQESTKLQYGLVEQAHRLGWSPAQVQVIDEDLGKSGSNAEGRPGFQRLVAEVGLNHVGIVLGIEMSRLARSCKDWHHLLEICAMFGTLIADSDGVYDPSIYNDRLLLGLKGTMSEAELHILKQRMLEGKRAKARRGELGMALPMGYFKTAAGQIAKDPDEQAQNAIGLAFALFERYGTLNGMLHALVKQGVKMPHRVRGGLSKGELEWRRPNRVTLSNMLHHPIYTGAYVYGRRPTVPRKKKPGRPSTGRIVAKLEDWQVLIKDAVPNYIKWEQYERNIKQLEMNTAQAMGVPRHGRSLLTGLIKCGRCGLSMHAQYSGGAFRYVCCSAAVAYAEGICQSLKGSPLDDFIKKEVLRALEPAALEISMRVAEDLEEHRRLLNLDWSNRLERAAYEVERAFRQYNAVDPENRLVARTLERQWEQVLEEQNKLQAEYARIQAETPVTLSSFERQEIRALANDVPALWNAESTSQTDRQAIIRHLVESVVVTVQGETEKVQVTVHWVGGHKTEGSVVRPVAKLTQLSYYPQLMERVAGLFQEGISHAGIAETLNLEGWRPAKRCDLFDVDMVQTLCARQGLQRLRKRHWRLLKIELKPNEWTIASLAKRLMIPEPTLYSWLRKKILTARCERYKGKSLWLVWADDAEIERLTNIRNTPRTWARHVRSSPPETLN